MRFFLKSIDVWFAIESGFNPPDKPTAEWSNVEKHSHVANDKAIMPYTWQFHKLSTLEFQIVIVPKRHGRS
jgi:hypothetical protein